MELANLIAGGVIALLGVVVGAAINDKENTTK